MIAISRIRIVLFIFGASAVLLSLSLVIGSFFRHVDTTDYLKQADEGVPWVIWGLCSAIAGIVLCWFGRRWWRVAGLLSSVLLLIWWYLVGVSLY